MSVQFGRWNYNGNDSSPDYLEKVRRTLAPYGPDSDESYSKGGVSILYRAFCTTKESWREKQPYVSSSGAVITWDGRLDNRSELIRELKGLATVESTDLAIVAAAYQRWGDNCLAKLIGDWALSISNPLDRSVLLAKDPFGSKHLYYSCEKDHCEWCTILDPLVLFAGKTFTICEEYIAGWFSQVPAVHLTPYVGIHSVPPSACVLLRPKKQTTRKYWDFNPHRQIRYRTDAEYEEHFREVFGQAVQRKLRSDRPVLADLSGGMDSGSIVSMADTVLARNQADCPRLDTVSWYDDSYDHLEPDSNELHWIAKVEEKRGRTGHHINMAQLKDHDSEKPFDFQSQFPNDHFSATPEPSRRGAFFERYAEIMNSNGYRVELSGIGGELPTGGGFPSPTPELQNYLARGRFLRLARQLKAWATRMKSPRLPLLKEAVRLFFTPSLAGVADPINSANPWFDRGFVRRNHAALCHYPTRTRFFGPLPSIQNMLNGLEFERRLMASFGSYGEVPTLLRDVRYPFLDRDLREFAMAVPWEQIVRVGQRRSLMKRALAGIVPEELLKRKPKGFLPPKSEKKETAREKPRLPQPGEPMVSGLIGIIDTQAFFAELSTALSSAEGDIGHLLATLKLESWLRHLTARDLLTTMATPVTKEGFSPLLEVKNMRA